MGRKTVDCTVYFMMHRSMKKYQLPRKDEK